MMMGRRQKPFFEMVRLLRAQLVRLQPAISGKQTKHRKLALIVACLCKLGQLSYFRLSHERFLRAVRLQDSNLIADGPDPGMGIWPLNDKEGSRAAGRLSCSDPVQRLTGVDGRFADRERRCRVGRRRQLKDCGFLNADIFARSITSKSRAAR